MTMKFFGNGCCRYDDYSVSSSQNRGYKTKEECRDICINDETCIACDVARPNGNTFNCFTFHGSGINFHTSCGTSNVDEICYKKVAIGILPFFDI